MDWLIFCYCWDNKGEKRHFNNMSCSFLYKTLPLAISATVLSAPAAAKPVLPEPHPPYLLVPGWGLRWGRMGSCWTAPVPVFTVNNNMETSCFYSCFSLLGCFDSSEV